MNLPCWIEPDEGSAARTAAMRIEDALRAALGATGTASLALSGGAGPWPMFRTLARADIDWSCVHVFQVDERVAPLGDADRNLTLLAETFLDRVPIPPDHLHPLPVDGADLDVAAMEAGRELLAFAPDGIDVVHLGLGNDGHTASLVPGDPVLEVRDRLVAPTAHEYQGHLRLTLTFPALASAQRIVWFVTGAAKAPALARLVAGDAAIPAGRVSRKRAELVCDRAAAAQVA